MTDSTVRKQKKNKSAHNLCGEWRYNPTAQAITTSPAGAKTDSYWWRKLVCYSHTHAQNNAVSTCSCRWWVSYSNDCETLLLGMSVEKNEADKVCMCLLEIGSACCLSEYVLWGHMIMRKHWPNQSVQCLCEWKDNVFLRDSMWMPESVSQLQGGCECQLKCSYPLEDVQV